jgi:hypothetical protein
MTAATILGHRKFTMTLQYADPLSPDRLREAVAALAGV